MIINYDCPNCGADMVYDPTVKMLHCHNCDHKEEVKEKEDYEGRNEIREDMDISVETTDIQSEAKMLHCPSCGAQLAIDAQVSSTICEYCGAPLVILDRLSGKMHPQQIVPFEITREQAEKALKKWCHNGRLAPKGFVSKRNLKRMQALYAPYWLFDTTTDNEMTATATRVHSYRSGDYMVKETEFYNLYRRTTVEYVNVDFDASKELDDTEMAKIGPYDFDGMKTFATPYLSGYTSEQYDYDEIAIEPFIFGKIRKYAESFTRSTMAGYTTVAVNNSSISFNDVDKAYTLMPLWHLNYQYKGKEYEFFMNGQTGRVAGKPPIAKGKAIGWFALFSSIGFVISMLVGVFAL